MKFPFLLKFISVFAISIGLLMALGSIDYKVKERDQYRSQAKHAIANGWSGKQIIVSPVLLLTLSKQYEEEVFDKNLEKYVTKQRTSTWTKWVLPDQLTINTEVSMQERYLGIYKVPVYEADLIFEGSFNKSLLFNNGTTLKKAELLSSFEDMRGISSTPKIVWNEKDIQFQPGANKNLLGNFISADITSKSPTSPASFRMTTRLRGLDSIRFVPAAKQVKASLHANWPHPYFQGRYLPVNRAITDNSFKAQWEMTEFATSVQNVMASCRGSSGQCASNLRGNTFGVGLHSPIDVYQKTDRSLKYGFLFIALTFAAFLLFEVTKRIKIHPIQYALVGCALAIFYLLLISLSEHLNFLMSYTIAALACVGLIGFYLVYVLHNKAQAIWMSVGMGLLYAMLYMILKSEDFALLMGTALTFVSLGALMIITRNINWYQIHKSKTIDSDSELPAESTSTT